MRRYLLDTCTLIWFIEKDNRVKDIVEDIIYFQGDFAVSMDALKELAYLLHTKKLKIDIDFDSLIKLLKELSVDIIDFTIDCLKVLFSLPFYKNHTDPTDRHIIATAIAQKRILISGDEKFRNYKKNGLLFLEI
jgi:PIN domain nuclease of toxin-antitoxin system